MKAHPTDRSNNRRLLPSYTDLDHRRSRPCPTDRPLHSPCAAPAARTAWIALVVFVVTLIGLGAQPAQARPGSKPPLSYYNLYRDAMGNEIPPSAFFGDSRSSAINTAVAEMRARGGGTIYLGPGDYYLDEPIVIDAVGLSPSDDPPNHVHLLGAQPVTSTYPQLGYTRLIWIGADDAPVIDVQHSRNVTLENLFITAAEGYWFRYGIFFHRIYTSKQGEPTQIAPSSLNVLDTGISKGDGGFTVGIRFGNASDHPEVPDGYFWDANVDHNFMENVYILGAREDGDLEAAGVWIDGGQIQANYFRDLWIEDCRTGVYVSNGQLQLVGGYFLSNTIDQADCTPTVDPLRAGDFVFRTGFAAGHLIQDVTSGGSWRFLSTFGPDPLNDYQHFEPMAMAIVNNWVWDIDDCDAPSPPREKRDVIFQRGESGPMVVEGCFFGPFGGNPVHIRNAQWTQGSMVVSDSTFWNSTGPAVVDEPDNRPNDRGKREERPRSLVVNTFGQPWFGAPVNLSNASDKNDEQYQHVSPGWSTPRDSAWRPWTGSCERDLTEYIDLGLVIPRIDKPDLSDLAIDNAPFINSLIDELMNPDCGGGTIWFPRGAFPIKTPIYLHSKHNVRLIGVGGRSGSGYIRDPDDMSQWRDDFGKGTLLVWNGPETDPGSTMVDISWSYDIRIEGLFFTDWDYPELPPDDDDDEDGSSIVERAILIRNSHNIWMEDLGGGWRGGDPYNAPRDGAFRTFLEVGDGTAWEYSYGITLMRSGIVAASREAVKIDGPWDTDNELVLALLGSSNRGVHVTENGGAFRWYGGGAGNAARLYDDPDPMVTDDGIAMDLELLTATSYAAGMEMQDGGSYRALRMIGDGNSAPLNLYGIDFYLAAPENGDFVELDGPSSGNVHAFANLFGARQLEDDEWDTEFPVRIAVRNGSTFRSLGNVYTTRGPERPWDGAYDTAQLVQDVSSIGVDLDEGGNYPHTINAWKYFRSDIGTYAISLVGPGVTGPRTVRSGTKFKVQWQAGAGDAMRFGDWAGIYEEESYPDLFTPLVNFLITDMGNFDPSGTTLGEYEAPAYDAGTPSHNTYELRYHKRGGPVSVYRIPIHVVP